MKSEEREAVSSVVLWEGENSGGIEVAPAFDSFCGAWLSNNRSFALRSEL